MISRANFPYWLRVFSWEQLELACGKVERWKMAENLKVTELMLVCFGSYRGNFGNAGVRILRSELGNSSRPQ